MRWICPALRHSMPSLASELPVKGCSEPPALLTPLRHTQRRQTAAACKPSPPVAAASGPAVHPDVLEVLFSEEEIHQATFKLGRCATDSLTVRCSTVAMSAPRVRPRSFVVTLCSITVVGTAASLVRTPVGDAPQPRIHAVADYLYAARRRLAADYADKQPLLLGVSSNQLRQNACI